MVWRKCRCYRDASGGGANDPKCMDKRRWFLAQTLAKWLVLLLGLDLFVGGCPRSFAQNNDSGLLNQQQNKLYQEGKYQEAIPIAEKLLAIRAKELGPEIPTLPKV